MSLPSHHAQPARRFYGFLAWPAWQRVLAVAPALALLWLAVLWASVGRGTSALITLNNLTVSYRQHPALHHVSGRFAHGSLTAVMGPNGSGKSTLLKSIAGLQPVEGGLTTRVGPVGAALTIAPAGTRIAYLPQTSEIDRSFPISVRDCAMLGCWDQAGAWGGIAAGQMHRVDEALAAVGLQGFESRTIGSLSSGQLQRVMFARLLVQDATTDLAGRALQCGGCQNHCRLADPDCTVARPGPNRGGRAAR